MRPRADAAISRRDALRALGALGVLALAGCAPARIVLGLYDRPAEDGPAGAERTLAAFADTVVPGLDPALPDRTRVYRDPSYPLARYRDYFVADLNRRAGERTAGRAFAALAAAERAHVVSAGLAAGGVTGDLYAGAVFLTQIALYAGIYDDEAGCALIDYPGGGRPLSAAEQGLPRPERFFAESRSPTGNPA
jgi:hypothetical protein